MAGTGLGVTELDAGASVFVAGMGEIDVKIGVGIGVGVACGRRCGPGKMTRIVPQTILNATNTLRAQNKVALLCPLYVRVTTTSEHLLSLTGFQSLQSRLGIRVNL